MKDAAEVSSRVCNIGTGTSTSVNELARVVGEVFRNGAATIAHQPAQAAEICYSRAFQGGGWHEIALATDCDSWRGHLIHRGESLSRGQPAVVGFRCTSL